MLVIVVVAAWALARARPSGAMCWPSAATSRPRELAGVPVTRVKLAVYVPERLAGRDWPD